MTQDTRFYWRERAISQEIIRCTFSQMRWHSTLPLLIRREFYEDGADTGRHRHEDFYAVYVVQSGHGLHIIDDHPYGIVRGDVYMLLPGTVHAYRNYHSLEVDAFYFQPQLFSADEAEALQSLSGFWNLLMTTESSSNEQDAINEFSDHRLHLTPEHHREIEAIITELCVEFAATTREASLLTRSLFFRMLVHLARWQTHVEHDPRKEPGVASSAAAPGKQLVSYKIDIADVLRICEERFHEPLPVPRLAALMFLSPSRFTELFSHEVGMSPAAYIRRLRLERAQTLLRTTSLSATSIAHQVGFSDGAQLSRAFHATFHLTPTAYRAAFQKLEEV